MRNRKDSSLDDVLLLKLSCERVSPSDELRLALLYTES